MAQIVDTSLEGRVLALENELRSLRAADWTRRASVEVPDGTERIPLAEMATAPAAAATAQETADNAFADAELAAAAAAEAQRIADEAAAAATAAAQDAANAQSAADSALADAASALTAAEGAESTAAGKVTSYFQATAPAGLTAGDADRALWFDTDDGNRLYRWTGTAWSASDDTRIAAAVTAAGTAQAAAGAAQSTADAKIVTYLQTTAPTGQGAAPNLWLDTDDGNRLYRWSGSAWQDARDTTIAVAQSTASGAASAASAAQSTANAKTATFYQTSAPPTTGRTAGDLWVDTDAGNRVYTWNGAWTATPFAAEALSATARQLGAVTTYRQATAPASGMLTADFWIDSDDNRLYRYDGATWVQSQDTGIQAAATAASNAQTTASSALTAANGRNRVYSQATAPTGSFIAGDVWMDTANGNRLSVHSGTAWVLQTLGTGAFSASAVTATVLAADAVNGKTVTGATLRTAASGQRVQIDSTNGLVGYNAAGTAVTKIDTAGKLTAINALISGEIKTAESGPRIRLAQTAYIDPVTGTNGSSGDLQFFSGWGGETPASINATFNGAANSTQGGALTITGSSANAPAATLALATVEDPAGGYVSEARLRAYRFKVEAPINPVTSKAQRDALTKYDGLQVVRLDMPDRRIERWNGTKWCFHISGAATGTTDGNGFLGWAHGGGQVPVSWVMTPRGQANDTLTKIFKPTTYYEDATTLTMRAVRTDNHSFLAGNPVSVFWMAEF